MTTNNETHNHNLALVIAGSYSEYLNWRKDNPSVKYCKYIDRVEDLKGINGFLANIVLYGNYENSPVYQKTCRETKVRYRSNFTFISALQSIGK